MAVIYAIRPRCRARSECYVGSTMRNVQLRSREHVRASRAFPNRAVYRFVRAHGGWDRVRFVVMEDMPSAPRWKVLARERYYIRKHGTLNSIV